MDVLAELAMAAPLALLFSLPVALVGGLLLEWMRRRSIIAAMTALVLVPVTAALVGVLGVSGFMYTPQLVGTIVVCLVVAAVTVPAGLLLGRRVAREALWQREAREAERRDGGLPPGAGRRDEPRPALPAGRHPRHGRRAGRRRGARTATRSQIYLGRIRRETVRMATMVEDLFELSRATSGAAAAAHHPAGARRGLLGRGGRRGGRRRGGRGLGGGRPTRSAGRPCWAATPSSPGWCATCCPTRVRHTPPGGAVRLTRRDACDGEAWLAGAGRLRRHPGRRTCPGSSTSATAAASARTPGERRRGRAGPGHRPGAGRGPARPDRAWPTHRPGCRFEITLPLAGSRLRRRRSRAPAPGHAQRLLSRSSGAQLHEAAIGPLRTDPVRKPMPRASRLQRAGCRPTAHGIGHAEPARTDHPDRAAPAARPASGSRLHQHRPAAAQQLAGAAQQPRRDRRRCRCCRRPAGRGSQRALAGQRGEQVARAASAPARRRHWASASARHVDRRAPARRGRRARRPAGPARSPGRRTGPVQRSSSQRVLAGTPSRASGRRPAAPRRRRCAAAVAGSRPHRSDAVEARLRGHRPATAAANRDPGIRSAHRPGVGRGVHIGQLRRAGSTRSPPARSARRVRAPVSAREVGTSASSRRPARIAQPERPPAAVGGRPEHRVRTSRRRQRGQRRRAISAGVDLRGVHARPAAWAGRAAARRCRRARRRSGRRGPSPRCATTVMPRSACRSSGPRAAARRSPSSATSDPHAAAPPRTVSRVSSSAAAASSAARCGVAGGHSRVFTRPGTGALASTISHRGDRSDRVTAAARPCRGWPGPCRAPSRRPSTGRRPAASSAPASSVNRQPAAPARSSSSSG